MRSSYFNSITAASRLLVTLNISLTCWTSIHYLFTSDDKLNYIKSNLKTSAQKRGKKRKKVCWMSINFRCILKLKNFNVFFVFRLCMKLTKPRQMLQNLSTKHEKWEDGRPGKLLKNHLKSFKTCLVTPEVIPKTHAVCQGFHIITISQKSRIWGDLST